MRTQLLLGLVALLIGCSPTVIQEAPEAEGDDPGECSDDADNDQDGLFDCNDEDCAGAAACGDDDDSAPPGDDDDDSAAPLYEGDEPGECSDGADNDQDGDFDCDDQGCEGAPDCSGDDDDSASGGTMFFGNAFLFTEEDMAAFCEQYTAISGSITVQYSFATVVELPCLSYVGRSINVRDSHQVTRVSFPALTTLGGSLLLDEVEGLETVEFPLLETVAQADKNPNTAGVMIDAPSAASIDFSSLVAVATTIELDIGAAAAVDLSNLSSIGGHLDVNGGSAITLPNLATVGSSVQMVNVGGLTLSLPLLTSVGLDDNPSNGGFNVTGSTITTLSVPGLETIGGSFQLHANANLASIDFSALDGVGGTFNVTDNTLLATSTAEALLDQVLAGSGLGEGDGNISGNGPG